MSLLEDIESGLFGLRYSVPPRLQAMEESPQLAMLVDRENGLGWMFGYFDLRLDLSSEHHSLLKADIERHARDLFDRFFCRSDRPAGLAKVNRPRTDDADWSPVIDAQTTEVGGARALQVIHRLGYEPGYESVMGHLLVPLASGLFEFRIFGNAPVTGMREAALTDGIVRDAPGRDPLEVVKDLRQSFFDDARHDASFPTHPLSMVRAGLRSLRELDKVTVTAPAPAVPADVVAETDSFTVTPPARYLPLPSDKPDSIQCSRIAFAGTDGVQLLTVGRASGFEAGEIGTGKQLLRLAKHVATGSVPPGSTNVHVQGEVLPDRAGRPHARVYRSFDSPEGPQHAELRWFVDDGGAAVMILAGTPSCVPAAELAGETEQVAASYRIKADAMPIWLAPASRPKPWWKLW